MRNWIEQYLGGLLIEEKKSTIQVQGASNFGDYPFFTSGDNILVHDTFIVDGERLFLATGGKANIKFYNGKASYSTDTYVLRSEKASTKFLYYYVLNKLEFVNSNLFTGSGLKHLQKNEFKKLKFLLPESKPEQTCIAEILSTADEAIAHTEALIAKYQRIKTGLMQDLLTKGIDENDNIRSKATHKFVVKNGIEVPEEWEVLHLSYFIKKLESGVSVNSNDKPAGSGQYGVLKTSALSGCVFTSIQNKTVDDIEIKRLKCPVRKGSIIISRMNTPDLVGENALVENNFDNLFLPDRLWQTVFQNMEELNVFWLSKLLSSIKYRQKISFQATGTSGSMKNITKNDFLQIYIPKPDINEQVKIAQILESVNNNETKLNNNLQKLQSLKTGLLQDLLSGKVRVNMDNKN